MLIRILAIFALFFIVSMSQAHIVDMFECRAKITDLKTNDSSEIMQTIASHRDIETNLSFGERYPEDITVQKGSSRLSLSLSEPTYAYRIDFDLISRFAVKTIDSIPFARTTVCQSLSYQGCQKNKTCSLVLRLCSVNPDPFDQNSKWAQTTIVDGIPQFLTNKLIVKDEIIPRHQDEPNGARVQVGCAFKGTFRE